GRDSRNPGRVGLLCRCAPRRVPSGWSRCRARALSTLPALSRPRRRADPLQAAASRAGVHWASRRISAPGPSDALETIELRTHFNLAQIAWAISRVPTAVGSLRLAL